MADAVLPGDATPWWYKYTRWRQTSTAEAAAAEGRLLACGPAGASGDRFEAADTPLPGGTDQHYLHSIALGAAHAPPVVCLPGYGAGAAFYFRNLPPLATAGYRAYAVDWLGTGLSGRPAFTPADHGAAVSWFTDSLEQWRREKGLERIVLLGHSLGGYLAARYALQHPERVERLIVVGPAAVAARPGPPPESILYKAFAAAWESGVTPGQVVRALGPLAPGRTMLYAEHRFREGQGLGPAEQVALGEYVYHILAADGSGEFALPHLLAPGAWAREALVDSFAHLKVPVTFVYGESDWMDWRAGRDACEVARTQAGVPADLVRIPKAGHYAFIDQPEAFHAICMRALHGSEAAAAAAAVAAGRAPQPPGSPLVGEERREAGGAAGARAAAPEEAGGAGAAGGATGGAAGALPAI